jgi:hypothetical protein
MSESRKYIILVFFSLFINVFLSTTIFCAEIVAKLPEPNKLSVHCQWQQQYNDSNTSRIFLAGETIFGFVTVSGLSHEKMLQPENKETTAMKTNIADKKTGKTTPIENIIIGTSFLYVNPHVTPNSATRMFAFVAKLPDLKEGEYVLNFVVQDECSGLSGEDKLYFNIASPNTLKLVNVNFAQSVLPDQIGANQPHVYANVMPLAVYTMPIGNLAPAIRYAINGLEVNKDGNIDVHLIFTQYSENGQELWRYETSYTGNDFIKDYPFPGTFFLQKLYAGKFRAKIEVEDRNSKKKDTIELPYVVINSVDILNQYNYPKNMQPKAKKINETKPEENNQ